MKLYTNELCTQKHWCPLGTIQLCSVHPDCLALQGAQQQPLKCLTPRCRQSFAFQQYLPLPFDSGGKANLTIKVPFYPFTHTNRWVAMVHCWSHRCGGKFIHNYIDTGPNIVTGSFYTIQSEPACCFIVICICKRKERRCNTVYYIIYNPNLLTLITLQSFIFD